VDFAKNVGVDFADTLFYGVVFEFIDDFTYCEFFDHVHKDNLSNFNFFFFFHSNL